MRGYNEQTFNPVDFCFSWTTDGWYTWDGKAARSAAMAARAKLVKQLKAQGKTPRLSSSPGALISRGGIGSGRPHVEFVVTVFRVEW